MTTFKLPEEDFEEVPIYWLKHCKSWFGFTEPAKFVEAKDGGFFASKETGKQIYSIAQKGFKQPEGV